MRFRWFTSFVVVVAAVSFSSCGSAGGGTKVPPPTNRTVGGSVSGFSGPGTFALQNNGSDTVEIQSNGNFVFGKTVANGENYSVTILSEPANPAQFCAVKNGSGTAYANVTDVQITCTTPAEQTLYSFGSQPDGNYPQASLVLDSSGNLYGTTGEG
ncbi:MAG TPA: hypothetical protein VGS10_11750, partial [Terracidiphilus sp.]|nr:hypothetical protein [Terracidiphilus sp.]